MWKYDRLAVSLWCICASMNNSIFVAAAGSEEATKPTLDEPFQNSFESLSHFGCVTLFHRNGRVGCGTTERTVQTGSLKYLNQADDDSNTSKEPYVMVMEESDLTADNIDTVLSENENGLLQGILILNSTTEDMVLSPDAQSPQGKNTPSSGVFNSEYEWNPNGNGLINYDLYGTPMAYVRSAEVSDYVKSVSKENSQGNVDNIMAEFNYYMGPDNMDSTKCLSWKDTADDVWRPKCLPLGGTSVWGVAGSPTSSSQSGGRKLEDEEKNGRPVVMLATSIDATSMFHDASTGANSAASNILALLMAAKLLGANVDDQTLDGLNKRIAFGFFQGESYGFVGSRTFFRDVAYPGFECDESMTVPSVAKKEDSPSACLHPLRPSLGFQNLGEISGMIAVDQVGVLSTDQTLYAHNDGNDGSMGAFISKILQASSTDNFSVSESSVEGGDDYLYPPTPLSSLFQLSEGAVGGAVLAGYDDTYADKALYHSHLDSNQYRSINLDSVAAAATLLARSAVAAAYDDGSMDDDSLEAAVDYATNLIPELSADDETFVELSECLYAQGNCEMLKKYAAAERQRTEDETGVDLGYQTPLGSPPNYYVSVYDINNGQPFVQVGDSWYGSYTGEDYGKNDKDFFSMRPSVLESSIRGMLDDFIGRGSTSNGNGEDEDLISCKKSSSACSDVSYCSEDGDSAVCSGSGVCVCSRAHYHIALDEALEAAPMNSTGRFIISDDDEGVSAMYTEPYWSSSVGVRVYRDGGARAGKIALFSGLVVAATCFIVVQRLKQKMKKEKLY
mmetsp:Transcript_16665/g.23482  ORF Transcript_16665/g.23482 Transcript_16665/m.23482 type:complete len:789 (+) Transcript_16665:228-2594(+)